MHSQMAPWLALVETTVSRTDAVGGVSALAKLGGGAYPLPDPAKSNRQARRAGGRGS